MNKRQVLELLKPKAKMLGFSRKELAKVADSIMASLPEEIEEAEEESAIVEKIEEYMPLLQVGQSAASRQATAATRSKSNVLSLTETYDDESDIDDSDGNAPVNTPKNVKSKKLEQGTEHEEDIDDEDFKDAPKWAQKLYKMMSSANTTRPESTSRRAQIEELVKGQGSLGKHILKEFDQKTFTTDAEFDTYMTDLRSELDEYENERVRRGLDILGKPLGGRVPGSIVRPSIDSNEELNDDEVKAIARGEY